jgi:DNA mismatch endonuclease (patch repair protein)
MGFRFRLHRRDLPGKPDIVLPKYKLVIFVNGCFWHSHPGCRLASRPKTNDDYWGPKLASNVARDRRNTEELKALGWRVETVWECDSRDAQCFRKRLKAITTSLMIRR